MVKYKDGSGLITFEGIDGCGKSTQATMTCHFLSKLSYRAKLLREPGSTTVSEQIRAILLDKKNKMSHLTELFLYESARSEIVASQVTPLLERGNFVLLDRFYDSTTAYQGYGRQLDLKMVHTLNRIAAAGHTPDLTFLFDIDLETAAARGRKKKDRLELQSKAFFNRVRAGFLEIARKNRRVKVVDASRSIEAIFEDVKKILTRKFDLK